MLPARKFRASLLHPHRMRRRLTVGHRPLEPRMWVRLLPPQPHRLPSSRRAAYPTSSAPSRGHAGRLSRWHGVSRAISRALYRLAATVASFSWPASMRGGSSAEVGHGRTRTTPSAISKSLSSCGPRRETGDTGPARRDEAPLNSGAACRSNLRATAAGRPPARVAQAQASRARPGRRSRRFLLLTRERLA